MLQCNGLPSGNYERNIFTVKPHLVNSGIEISVFVLNQLM